MLMDKNTAITFTQGWSCALLSLFLLVAISVSPASAASERERTLVIGKVSSDPKKHYRYLKPMADYVVEQMQDLGIDRVKVLMARDNQQMVRYLKRGKVDWVTETVFSAVEFEEKAGAEMLLLKWKKGVPEYHTVFFARVGTDIKRLQDLKGKILTLQDLGSSSGFFIPAALMLEAGLELVQLESPREAAPVDAVGFVFGKEEINMATWVHKGVVDAGAYANLDWNREDHTPSAFKENIYIFHESESYPRAIELVRKGLRPEVKARLKAILLAAHEDPAAAEALKAYQETHRFEAIDAKVQRGIERARKTLKRVKSELDL